MFLFCVAESFLSCHHERDGYTSGGGSDRSNRGPLQPAALPLRPAQDSLTSSRGGTGSRGRRGLYRQAPASGGRNEKLKSPAAPAMAADGADGKGRTEGRGDSTRRRWCGIRGQVKGVDGWWSEWLHAADGGGRCGRRRRG